MSSHKSEHLDLHLWEPGDDFLRTEFNENFAAVDAHAGACSYVIGSYIGTAEERTIDVGFRPRLVLIGGIMSASTPNFLMTYAGWTNGSMLGNLVRLTDTGFWLAAQQDNVYPKLNHSIHYAYIAFR